MNNKPKASSNPAKHGAQLVTNATELLFSVSYLGENDKFIKLGTRSEWGRGGEIQLAHLHLDKQVLTKP